MNVVAGVGWIAEHEYGCLMKQLHQSYVDVGSLRSELQERSVFSYPPERFGKYDLVSKMACCVAALGLHDAGISYSQAKKQDIGILGSNVQGCLQSNIDFFEDFVANGRTRGRGSIFVYTLPSIPMAAAASCFNFCGPLLYLAFPEGRIRAVLSHSDGIVRRGEATAMLALDVSEDDAVCFVVRPAEDAAEEPALSLEAAEAMAAKAPSARELVEILEGVQGSKEGHRGLHPANKTGAMS